MRRFLPCKTDLGTIPAHELQALVERYNNTPGKRRTFSPPDDIFCDLLNPVALQT